MLSWWGMSPAHVGFITRLFVTRFRQSVGTLGPHGKAGVFTLFLYKSIVQQSLQPDHR